MEVPAASGFFSLLVKVVPASKVKARLVRAFVLYTRIRKSNPYGVLCPQAQMPSYGRSIPCAAVVLSRGRYLSSGLSENIQLF